jgi:hypothetical protein
MMKLSEDMQKRAKELKKDGKDMFSKFFYNRGDKVKETAEKFKITLGYHEKYLFSF